MINIEQRHLNMLIDILKKYPYTFYAFGSRVKAENQQFSDLDLCYMEQIPLPILSQISEKLEESNLPFKVDLIDFNAASTDFQNLIRADLVPLIVK